jgi:hypothetical protein
MSGIYQHWFKVLNPDASNDIPPMESGGFQKPFYFGGSQVPTALDDESHTITGRGIRHYSKTIFKPELKGKGVTPTKVSKHTNIIMPRQLRF